jgi:hypothetical protein
MGLRVSAFTCGWLTLPTALLHLFPMPATPGGNVAPWRRSGRRSTGSRSEPVYVSSGMLDGGRLLR